LGKGVWLGLHESTHNLVTNVSNEEKNLFNSLEGDGVFIQVIAKKLNCIFFQPNKVA
jgi:hypothetical protein